MKAIDLFIITLSQDSFESDCLEQSFKQSLPKVSLKKYVQKFITEFWTVISNQKINYQLPHTCFNHKHNIYFYGKLSTKLLAQAASANTKFDFTKTGQLLNNHFHRLERGNCPETCFGFWAVSFLLIVFS